MKPISWNIITVRISVSETDVSHIIPTYPLHVLPQGLTHIILLTYKF